MRISVLIPTYNRPGQLAEAIASVAVQDLSLVEEILVGDNSCAEMLRANRAVIAASPVAALIQHVPNEPPVSPSENFRLLAERARCDHVLFLHDDDHLSSGGLAHLVAACAGETDSRVKVWFGRNYLMDDNGRIDEERTVAKNRQYGKDGPGIVRPLWQWCLTQSLPPNCSILERASLLQYMEGPRDGNVPDWGLWVRLSNAGLKGCFVPEFVWSYREQAASQTASGRGMDAHRFYELGLQLNVPPGGAEAEKAKLLSGIAKVAAMRYLRDGERVLALKCFASNHWTWDERLSSRGLATIFMLALPRFAWRWALRGHARVATSTAAASPLRGPRASAGTCGGSSAAGSPRCSGGTARRPAARG